MVGAEKKEVTIGDHAMKGRIWEERKEGMRQVE